MENPTIDFTESMISKITTLSATELFGHLFDLHMVQILRLRNTEELCRRILHDQLQIDLLPRRTEIDTLNGEIAISELEQSLAVLFSSNSSFWEEYYTRKNNNTVVRNRTTQLIGLSAQDIAQFSRQCYPWFFIPVEAMYFGELHRQADFTLITSSLHAFLSAHLLGACGHPQDSANMLGKALKLIGPLNLPAYRAKVRESMDWSYDS